MWGSKKPWAHTHNLMSHHCFKTSLESAEQTENENLVYKRPFGGWEDSFSCPSFTVCFHKRAEKLISEQRWIKWPKQRYDISAVASRGEGISVLTHRGRLAKNVHCWQILYWFISPFLWCCWEWIEHPCMRSSKALEAEPNILSRESNWGTGVALSQRKGSSLLGKIKKSLQGIASPHQLRSLREAGLIFC